MSKSKRKPRETEQKVEYSEPIDITQFGSEDDPCFGKLYDLSTDECRRCGDSELCGLIFAQNQLKNKRKEIESKSRFKDTELTKEKKPINETLIKWVGAKKKEGMKRGEVIQVAKKTFGTTREEIKGIWKKIK